MTFEFNNDTVLKCINRTEDDSPEQVRLLLESVVNKFMELYINASKSAVAKRLFLDEDWQFAKGHEVRVRETAEATVSEPLSAGKVMRDSRFGLKRLKKQGADYIRSAYTCKGVGVKFVGKVDEVDDHMPSPRLTSQPALLHRASTAPRFPEYERSTMDTSYHACGSSKALAAYQDVDRKRPLPSGATMADVLRALVLHV